MGRAQVCDRALQEFAVSFSEGGRCSGNKEASGSSKLCAKTLHLRGSAAAFQLEDLASKLSTERDSVMSLALYTEKKTTGLDDDWTWSTAGPAQ